MSVSSFPERVSLDDSARLFFSNQFPTHLIPLPHAKYTSKHMQWLNVLSEEERAAVSSPEGPTNVLSYVLLLGVEQVVEHPLRELVVTASQEAAFVQNASSASSSTTHEGSRRHFSMNATVLEDGSLVRTYSLFPREWLDLENGSCRLSILPEAQQEWAVRSFVSNRAGLKMTGSTALVAADPPLRTFHAFREAVSSSSHHGDNSFTVHPSESDRDNIKARLAQLSFTRPEAEEVSFLENTESVFLAEHTFLKSKAKMVGLLLQLGIGDKLMQIAMDFIERYLQYITPKISQLLITHFGGEGAAG